MKLECALLQSTFGIWTMESKESLPLKIEVLTGTPMTGRGVIAATIPGKCAAPPAPAMMTCEKQCYNLQHCMPPDATDIRQIRFAVTMQEQMFISSLESTTVLVLAEMWVLVYHEHSAALTRQPMNKEHCYLLSVSYYNSMWGEALYLHVKGMSTQPEEYSSSMFARPSESTSD
jgi:hypothetical protein